MTTATASKYTAAEITALEGLEPVRKRPSMYIGGVDARGLHHLVWEIIDNAVDFAGSQVRIAAGWDAGSLKVAIEDDGPGFAPEIFERIGEPQDERRFRADHDEIDPLAAAELDQPLDVARADRDALGFLGDPGIAGRAE